jgi:hypothetical protein
MNVVVGVVNVALDPVVALSVDTLVASNLATYAEVVTSTTPVPCGVRVMLALLAVVTVVVVIVRPSTCTLPLPVPVITTFWLLADAIVRAEPAPPVKLVKPETVVESKSTLST